MKTIQTSQENLPVQEEHVKSSLWPDFKFPPINLWNMAVFKEAAEYHASQQDPSLFGDKLNDKEI